MLFCYCEVINDIKKRNKYKFILIYKIRLGIKYDWNIFSMSLNNIFTYFYFYLYESFFKPKKHPQFYCHLFQSPSARLNECSVLRSFHYTGDGLFTHISELCRYRKFRIEHEHPANMQSRTIQQMKRPYTAAEPTPRRFHCELD